MTLGHDTYVRTLPKGRTLFTKISNIHSVAQFKQYQHRIILNNEQWNHNDQRKSTVNDNTV
jgi:hypothetical protein